jgi:hypothetical protein
MYVRFPLLYVSAVDCHRQEVTPKTRAVESESEGILGGVGVGRNF